MPECTFGAPCTGAVNVAVQSPPHYTTSTNFHGLGVGPGLAALEFSE